MAQFQPGSLVPWGRPLVMEEAGIRAHAGFMTEYWVPQSKGSAPVPIVTDMLERGGGVPDLPTTVMSWHTWQVC